MREEIKVQIESALNIYSFTWIMWTSGMCTIFMNLANYLQPPRWIKVMFSLPFVNRMSKKLYSPDSDKI